MGGVTKIAVSEGSRFDGLKQESGGMKLKRGRGIKNGRSAFTLQIF